MTELCVVLSLNCLMEILPTKAMEETSFAMSVAEVFTDVEFFLKKYETNNEDEGIDVWMGNFSPHILGGLGTASYGLTNRHGFNNPTWKLLL